MNRKEYKEVALCLPHPLYQLDGRQHVCATNAHPFQILMKDLNRTTLEDAPYTTPIADTVTFRGNTHSF
jgi:hypothetical protein